MEYEKMPAIIAVRSRLLFSASGRCHRDIGYVSVMATAEI